MGNSCNSQTQLSTARLLTDAVDISACRKRRGRGRQRRANSKESSQGEEELQDVDVDDRITTNEVALMPCDDDDDDVGIRANSSNNKTNVKLEEDINNNIKEACERKSSMTNSQKFDKLKEGVDFIENEADVEAVESAVVKIQSTFRGKKFRSKKATTTTTTTTTTEIKEDNSCEDKNKEKDKREQKIDKESKELSDKMANIHCEDADSRQVKQTCGDSNAPEEEAEKAAVKIQAGFKGYKTRKELEAKLSGGASGGAGSTGSGSAATSGGTANALPATNNKE